VTAAVYRTKIRFDMHDANGTTAEFQISGSTYGTLTECVRLMCKDGTYKIPTSIYSGRRLLRTEIVTVTVAGKRAAWSVA